MAGISHSKDILQYCVGQLGGGLLNWPQKDHPTPRTEFTAKWECNEEGG